MLTRSLPLFSTAISLRNDKIDLLTYIDQVREHIEKNEDKIQALIPEKGRFERLRLEAENLIQKYPDPATRPPLYGVLVGVKDIFHVNGFPTGAGSRLDPALLEGPEASAVKILKDAGALILGKTVTTEFAYYEPGPTRNPQNIGYTPGGSSSGSAAAVAAGYCPLALGTQTIGSTIRPAAFCNVVGFKPTYNRIDPQGIIPFSASVDHVGIFTQDLKGMELVASILCMNWKGSYSPKRKKPVLGIPQGPYLEKASPATLEAFNKNLKNLEENGFVVKKVQSFKDIDRIASCHGKLIGAELAEVHKDWFVKFKDKYRKKTAELILQGQKVGREELEEVRAARLKLRDELMNIMDRASMDLWVAPAAVDAIPQGIESTGDPAMNLPWTNSGLPSLYIPGGISPKMIPLGLQITARVMDDEAILIWGKEIGEIISQA